MPTATAMPHPEIETKLINLLVAGSARVGRLLDAGEFDKAKTLCRRINTVCSSFERIRKGQDLRAALDAATITSLPRDISAVYSAPEFQTDDGTVDCSPLCWSEADKACIVC